MGISLRHFTEEVLIEVDQEGFRVPFGMTTG